jgi:transketolase C-terminal domain/subunit
MNPLSLVAAPSCRSINSGRAWDQIRTTICYSNLNVKIAGAHGGISVGPDGATHQALEEIALTTVLPNMNVVVPCDSVETQKATEHALLSFLGPCYLRFAREATPIVTKPDTPYEFGVAKGASGISLPAQFCGTARISANPCSSIWWASPIASAFRAIPGN